MFEGNLANFIRMISKEKDLDVETIKEAIEEAIISTARKPPLNLMEPRPALDLETGHLDIFVIKEVVPRVQDSKIQIDKKAAKKIQGDADIGDLVEVKIDPELFGRIAAQSVRQGIMQRLRDAEHEKIYNEYIHKVGMVITGIVQRMERRNLIVQAGKVETVMPQSETPRGIRYRFGDRIKVYIQDVQKTQRGPEIRVSRACQELVIKLFEQEVPEIADETVKIMSIAREAGVRTKIAVTSSNPDVDPVGACVGMKGSRVQMIVRELDNEKIDIIPYSANPRELIKSALNPAEVLKVILNENSRMAQVIVTQNSLSLAIGKRGQNAKLAAKLTGWKIDILSEEKQELMERMEEMNRRYLQDFLTQVEDMSQLARDALIKSPYNSVEKISKTSPALLLNFTNGDLELAQSLVEGAGEYLAALEELAKEIQEQEAIKAEAEPEEKEEEIEAGEKIGVESEDDETAEEKKTEEASEEEHDEEEEEEKEEVEKQEEDEDEKETEVTELQEEKTEEGEPGEKNEEETVPEEIAEKKESSE